MICEFHTSLFTFMHLVVTSEFLNLKQKKNSSAFPFWEPKLHLSSHSHLLYIGSVVISFVTEFRIDTEVLPVFPLTVIAVISIYKRIKVWYKLCIRPFLCFRRWNGFELFRTTRLGRNPILQLVSEPRRRRSRIYSSLFIIFLLLHLSFSKNATFYGQNCSKFSQYVRNHDLTKPGNFQTLIRLKFD